MYPWPIQVLSQKVTGGGPGWWRQVGRCPPQSARFSAKNSHFSPKRAPQPGQNAQTKGNGGHNTRAACLHRIREPSGALQLHSMSEKRPKKTPKSPKICAICTNTPKPSTGRILGYMAQDRVPRAPSAPATPHFLWFASLRIGQQDAWTPVQVVTWWSRRVAGPAHGWGQRWVHQGPRGEKNDFFQNCSQTTWDARTSVFSPF